MHILRQQNAALGAGSVVGYDQMCFGSSTGNWRHLTSLVHSSLLPFPGTARGEGHGVAGGQRRRSHSAAPTASAFPGPPIRRPNLYVVRRSRYTPSPAAPTEVSALWKCVVNLRIVVFSIQKEK